MYLNLYITGMVSFMSLIKYLLVGSRVVAGTLWLVAMALIDFGFTSYRSQPLMILSTQMKFLLTTSISKGLQFCIGIVTWP
jgi:hypothetical protein